MHAVGRFRGTETVHIPQLQNGPIAYRQSQDLTLNGPPQLVDERLLLRIQARVDAVINGSLSHFKMGFFGNAMFLTGSRHGLVDGDAKQPGRKLRLSGELIQVRVSIQIDLLHKVIDFINVPYDSLHDAADPALIAGH